MRTISLLNAIIKADKMTSTVPSIRTYSIVAWPLRPDKPAVNRFFNRILCTVIVRHLVAFGRNKPLFYGFYHGFRAAAYTQLMESTV